ncbi:MAG: glycoside hydrolase family 13 protein [Bacteroidales bacterium]|nr:glycoside hydrolase family 13 protein [Bacteroidales bacterium]
MVTIKHQYRFIKPKKSIHVFILALFTVAIQLSFAADKPVVDRVEPAFWWAGMVHPELQVLIHGENIADLAPSFSYKGVNLQQIIKVENPNYLFLDFTLSPDVKPGSFPIEFKRKGKLVFTYTYELKQRRVHSAERRGFSNKDIIYLVTPDRFANGDALNDTVEWMREKANRKNIGGRHGGDIQGLIDHLDYIQDMGFTALWINPLLENNMEEYSYHGYATTDYYKIDDRFGSNEDYLRLSEEAKKRGILIIMDMIANHCGLFHWWTGDEPTKDWYNFQEQQDKPYSSHQRVTLTDPYATKADRTMFSDGWFVDVMPDLNQRNPLLAAYLIQNSIWWIEYADLGGIREDTYSYPDAEFMSEWSGRIMQEYPNFNIVGEEWSVNPAMVSRWQAGKTIVNGCVSYLPSLMDFPLQKSLVTSLNKKIEPYSNTFNDLYEMLANDFLYNDAYNLVIFPDNHDMPRFFNQVHGNADLFKMGLVYLYTTRGIPQIFYGTEIFMGNIENPGDHGVIRSDMPGGWKGDTVNVFTDEGLSKEQQEMKDFVKHLTRFRRDTPALHNGTIQHYTPVNEVYVMFRQDEKTKIMAVFNKNPEKTVIDLVHYAETLEGATKAKNVLTGESYDLINEIITVPGISATLFIIE